MIKTVIWTKQAKNQRKAILKYWITRNKSNTYSAKLNVLFGIAATTLSRQPKLGRPTEIENIRQRIIKNYKMFYKIEKSNIYIIALVDMRRAPDTIRKMLE